MKTDVLWDYMLLWLINTDFWGNVLPVPSASNNLVCNIPDYWNLQFI